jgi:hypothetical protein
MIVSWRVPDGYARVTEFGLRPHCGTSFFRVSIKTRLSYGALLSSRYTIELLSRVGNTPFSGLNLSAPHCARARIGSVRGI